MMPSEATKTGPNFGDVVSGVGVEDDDVVAVRGDAFQTFDDLIDGFENPVGGGTAAMRHHSPRKQSARRAEQAVKGAVSS